MDGSAPFQPWTSSTGDEDADTKHESSQTGPASSPHEASNIASQGVMNVERIDRMQQLVEHNLSVESRQHISGLLSQVSNLSPTERLLLYLKLPCGAPATDPLKQPLNPLGSRSEIHQTIMWIQTHLEVDPEISLPKQDVYEEYIEYCTRTKMKPLSTADFGKVMKQVYPCVKPRRLGTRGNSRYCYAGMRKRIKLDPPRLPDLGEKQKMTEIPQLQNDLLIAASQLIREWAEKLLGIKFNNLCQLAQHLVSKNSVDAGSNAAMLLADILAENKEASPPAEEDSLHQRGVIKQLKRKIQIQPNQSPSKSGSNSSKRSRTSEEFSPPSATTNVIPSDPAPSAPQMPMPLPLAVPHSHPFIKSEPPTPPYHPYSYPSYPNVPMNLSATNTQLPPPTTATPRLHPLPGKKMILEAYNSENQHNSPREYSPIRVPLSTASPQQEYLPKKMRALESSTRMLPMMNVNSPDTSYSAQPLYSHPITADCLNLSSMSSSNANLSVQQLQPNPPMGYYSVDSNRATEMCCDSQASAKPTSSKYKGKKCSEKMNLSLSESTNSSNCSFSNSCKTVEPPRHPQRGRPRKKSLSKAKYTRRRPLGSKGQTQLSTTIPSDRLNNNRGPVEGAGAGAGPTQCTNPSSNNPACGSCGSCGLSVICGENHAEILNRERVSSICNMDKHSLDDYLNEGNSQEHEEELMKYLPRETTSPLGLVDSLVQPKPQDASSESLLAEHMHESSLRTDCLGVNLEDPEDCGGSNNDAKLSQIRDFFQKSFRKNSCSGYENISKQANEPPNDGFVPISSPTASPFVSPRSTPRGRRPQLSVKPPAQFPMSAPPSPNISKYKPCYVDQGASSVLRSYLQEPAHLPSPRPPLSAEPLSREVNQFFPESAYTNRSQSVPLHGNTMLPDFNHPPEVQPPVSYSSFTTPCSSIPPTPTPADFSDFVNLDPIPKDELVPEIIYDALYNDETAETNEGVLGALELPNTSLQLGFTLTNNEREVLRRSMSADTSGPETFPSFGGSRSVPSTPAERSYANRDFLINGNSVDKSPNELLADLNSSLYYDNL